MSKAMRQPPVVTETFQSADETVRRENLAEILDGYLRRNLQDGEPGEGE